MADDDEEISLAELQRRRQGQVPLPPSEQPPPSTGLSRPPWTLSKRSAPILLTNHPWGGLPTTSLHALHTADRRNQHTYVVGTSGTGKTTLLEQLAVHAFENGDGLAFIDPHGDAAEDLLARIPEERLDDVVWFDPTSDTCPPFNLLALPYEPHKLVADIVSAFQMFFADSWGPQLEMLLGNGLSTLLADQERHSLADLRRLLVDPNYRNEIVGRSPSEQLRDFWFHAFPALPKSATNPVLNKLHMFLMPLSPLERLFSQRENALDFSSMMNSRKILLVKLSKGELGEKPSAFLGGLIVTALCQAALARVKQENRPPFFLVADEFQTYVIPTFTTILAEGRKYGLHLTLATQVHRLVPPEVRSSLGNAATLIALRVEPEDATALAKNFRGTAHTIQRRDRGATRFPLPTFTLIARAALIDYEYKRAVSYNYGLTEKTSANLWRIGMRKPRPSQFEPVPDRPPPFTDPAAEEIRQSLECNYGGDLKRIVSVLEEGHPHAIKKIFGDVLEWYDIQEGIFPGPHDLADLPNFHALCRVDRPSNTSLLQIPELPPPSPEIRQRILSGLRARAPKPSFPPTPSPSAAAASTPPVTEDDFTF